MPISQEHRSKAPSVQEGHRKGVWGRRQAGEMRLGESFFNEYFPQCSNSVSLQQ